MEHKAVKIMFIVDGGFEMGLGHVYQSITFAKRLEDMANICFLTKSDEIVVNKIEDAGFIAHKLLSDSEILLFLQQNKPEIVIFDKIDVSVELAKDIKKDGQMKLVIFTNLSSANRYADIAVTADIGSNFKNIKFMDWETNTLYFYGPKYWILRKEFHEFNKLKKEMPKNIERILLIFGGSDPSNLTTLTIKDLLKLSNSFEIDVIIGAAFEHFETFNATLKEYEAANRLIKIHRDVKNVAELMFKADLVIASPGLSAFEALYVGTPIVVIPQNVLQKETYQSFFKLIDQERKDNLVDIIANMDFTYPNQKHIVDMEIAGGMEELIKEIIGELR